MISVKIPTRFSINARNLNCGSETKKKKQRNFFYFGKRQITLVLLHTYFDL